MTSRSTGRTGIGAIRAAITVLLCCCAGVTAAACSGGSGAKSPDTGVTAPSVGRPAMASSIAAALARQAFTPYVELGMQAGDGLAPNEASSSLGTACLTEAGYPGDGSDLAGNEQIGDTLRGTTTFGAFGYVGSTTADQSGFRLGGPQGPGAPSGQQSEGEATAISKCSTIVGNFGVAEQDSALAGIDTLGTTIVNADLKDPSVAKATKAWSACMKTSGYVESNPATLTLDEMHLIISELKASAGLSGSARSVGTGASLTAAQSAAQIALAQADAACTQSTDLAGIFFAVQASYEQQVVSANTQQLNAAVQRYRAAYQKELKKLTALLATTSGAPSGGQG